MWSPTLLLVLSTIILPVSAALVKTGSTCVVTPLTDTPAAVLHRSIGAVAPSDRDLTPDVNNQSSDDDSDLWASVDPYSHPAPGHPGALGHYPRAEPGSPASTTPLRHHHGPFPRQTARPDDTPQILQAFSQCKTDSTIIFREGTYHIRQVMDTTDLRNVSIEIYGTFVWSADNLSYWRQKSFSVMYAGRQTAWRIGGRDIVMRGFGKALFDGNGQAWIDLARGQGNLDGRPISLTVWKGTNVLIDGITW